MTTHGPQTLDWNTTKRIARRMTDATLAWSINDCIEAGLAARELERAGCRVSKDEGFYLDEASVYRAELKRRQS